MRNDFFPVDEPVAVDVERDRDLAKRRRHPDRRALRAVLEQNQRTGDGDTRLGRGEGVDAQREVVGILGNVGDELLLGRLRIRRDDLPCRAQPGAQRARRALELRRRKLSVGDDFHRPDGRSRFHRRSSRGEEEQDRENREGAHAGSIRRQDSVGPSPTFLMRPERSR